MATLATNYTPISIISVISLVGGYGGLWLLWRLVFSSKRTHDDTLDRDRIAAMRAAEGSPGTEASRAAKPIGRTEPSSGVDRGEGRQGG